MTDKLYFVENNGCDDTTRGLVCISNEDFPKFKEFIENLNKNSTYGCMPTISVYEADQTWFRILDDDEIGVIESDIFYLNGNKYTFSEKYKSMSYYEIYHLKKDIIDNR